MKFAQTHPIPIHGHCKEHFEHVYQVFYDNFKFRGELGASVCIWHKGEKVVDLWGGFQDPEKTSPWEENTLSILFSATKGVVAACFLMLVS